MSEKELDAIDKEMEALSAKRKAIVEKSRGAALVSVQATITKYAFTAEELGFEVVAPQKTAKASPKAKKEAKYKDPATGQTWAGGKGPKPKFIKDALTAGKSIDVFLIKK